MQPDQIRGAEEVRRYFQGKEKSLINLGQKVVGDIFTAE